MKELYRTIKTLTALSVVIVGFLAVDWVGEHYFYPNASHERISTSSEPDWYPLLESSGPATAGTRDLSAQTNPPTTAPSDG